MINPSLPAMQATRLVATDLAVSTMLSEEDRMRFVFPRVLVPFMLTNHILPRYEVGDQRTGHRGGRARSGRGEGTKGFTPSGIPIDVAPQLKEFQISLEAATADHRLGRTAAVRKMRYRAMMIGAATRELMVFHELDLLGWLTTLANWHPEASATVGNAAKWTETTADVYGQILRLIEASGGDEIIIDPHSYRLASTHPSIRQQLGDSAPKNLSEEELLGVFKRIHPQLSKITVVRSVGDPDKPDDYLCDGSTIPTFVFAGHFNVPSMTKNLAKGAENGPLPSVDVGGIMALERIEDYDLDGVRVPAEETGNFFVILDQSYALREQCAIWTGLKPHVLNRNRGAVLVATHTPS